MARELRIESSLTPEEVFTALDARNRDWRESDIPVDLKRYGALGFRVKRDGDSFNLRIDRPQRDNVVWIDCQGTIRQTPHGCRIEARCRRTGATWLIILLVWLFAGWQVVRNSENSSAFYVAGIVSVLFLMVHGIFYLIRDSQAETENRAFETILRRAAAGDTSPLTSPHVAA